jgi:hypothetical protein
MAVNPLGALASAAEAKVKLATTAEATKLAAKAGKRRAFICVSVIRG